MTMNPATAFERTSHGPHRLFGPIAFERASLCPAPAGMVACSMPSVPCWRLVDRPCRPELPGIRAGERPNGRVTITPPRPRDHHGYRLPARFLAAPGDGAVRPTTGVDEWVGARVLCLLIVNAGNEASRLTRRKRGAG